MVTQTGLEILWCVEIKTTTKINHNKPNIVVKMPRRRKWQLIDIAIIQDHNIVSKENEKINKYIDLAGIIKTEHKVKTEIVPLIQEVWVVFRNNSNHTLFLLVSQTIISSTEISSIMSTAKTLRDDLSL